MMTTLDDQRPVGLVESALDDIPDPSSRRCARWRSGVTERNKRATNSREPGTALVLSREALGWFHMPPDRESPIPWSVAAQIEPKDCSIALWNEFGVKLETLCHWIMSIMSAKPNDLELTPRFQLVWNKEK
jgi:hypothetical protein